MGMSDYDIVIKDYQFRVLELCNEIARLNSHIETLETTLAAMSGELHALRMETQ